jgi:hypothetical protein
MGKKPQRHTWPEAKKLCRLNQLDIEMAKRLGFEPDALIRAIPSPKQKWKLPVKDWVHELHFKRFGNVLDEKPLDLAPAGNGGGPEAWESGPPWESGDGGAPSGFPPTSFIPIKLCDYVHKHLQANPRADEREMTVRLREALAAYKAGAVCQICGEPIWVIGSAEVGNFCFTCATGESDPSDDYEIVEACQKPSVRHTLPDPDPSLDAVFIDSDPDDRDIPF